MDYIITIGRELGSGGRSIGRLVSQKLGIPYYDRHEIDQVAEKAGISIDYIKANEQKTTSSFLYNLALGSSLGFGNMEGGRNSNLPLSERIFSAQSEAIRGFADQGPCVIVGRCADYVLDEYPNVLKIFIYADLDIRTKHAIEAYQMNPSGAEKEVLKFDKNRSRHYYAFTERVWGDRKNYDLMLNSGLLGYENCAQIICDVALHQRVRRK